MEKIEYGSLKAYLSGFIVSIALTLLAFYLVMANVLQRPFLDGAIGLLAIGQTLLQLMLFLNLTSGEKPRWKLIVFLFMILITVILVFGSLWIMYNLNYNLM